MRIVDLNNGALPNISKTADTEVVRQGSSAFEDIKLVILPDQVRYGFVKIQEVKSGCQNGRVIRSQSLESG
ncbi:hypothetical protein WIW50_04475 [Flavobacteriaceae bacterium 3-367]